MYNRRKYFIYGSRRRNQRNQKTNMKELPTCFWLLINYSMRKKIGILENYEYIIEVLRFTCLYLLETCDILFDVLQIESPRKSIQNILKIQMHRLEIHIFGQRFLLCSTFYQDRPHLLCEIPVMLFLNEHFPS
ncbi:hypothetical protein HHI36_016832 [Cryptolaemus montrouzieri]|uniref:Uncharacterized protein n=1 Tax=Cryptolaemus montrouzieri TaxID=559131 RepID=A0ABD2NL73_9CUCU